MPRTALAGLVAVVLGALGSLIAMPASAAPGGRIALRDQPVRPLDTRTGADAGKVTSIEVGAGVLQVWVLNPDSAGTAVIHPCDESAPTDRVSFRLDASQSVQYTRLFTPDAACITASIPVHIVVDESGTVAETADATSDQYVALATPRPLSTDTIAARSTLVIPRPAQVTVDASAAIVSLQALLSAESGFVTAFGCDSPRPFVADLSYSRGLVANVAAVAIAPGEDLCVYSSEEVSLRTTLLGELRDEGPTPDALPPTWNFEPGQITAPSLRSINPTRELDTRNGTGRPAIPVGADLRPDTSRLTGDETFEMSFGDLVGPLTTAVSMNVTAADATDDGFLTVWPCDGDRPEASNLNFTDFGAVPNLVVTKLGPEGTVCISASSDVHVIADVNGTYEDDGGLHAVSLEPERILDTRSAVGTALRGRVTGGSELELQVTGGDVPVGAGAATLNVTATGSDENGFVTVYPCGSPRPTASNLNFRAGEAAPNLVTTALSASGTVCLYTSEAVHLIADLASWYGLEQPAGLVDLTPTRVLDTRLPIGVENAGRVTSSEVVVLDFALTPDVAADADAVVMNVTAAQAAAIGFVTAWPCDQDQPTVSNLNIRPGRTVANLTTVKLSADGTVCLTSTSSTHLIADVAGYLTDVPVAGDELVLDS